MTWFVLVATLYGPPVAVDVKNEYECRVYVKRLKIVGYSAQCLRK